MSNIAYRSGPQCYPPPNFAGQTAWLLVLVITAGGQHQLGTLHLVQHLQYSTVQYSTIQYGVQYTVNTTPSTLELQTKVRQRLPKILQSILVGSAYKRFHITMLNRVG